MSGWPRTTTISWRAMQGSLAPWSSSCARGRETDISFLAFGHDVEEAPEESIGG